MEIERIKLLIQDKYAELSRDVIAEIDCTVALEESQEGDVNVWREFAREVQDYSDEPPFTSYDAYVEDACVHCMESLSSFELKLLWLGSGRYVEWNEEDPAVFPSEEEIWEDVQEELFSWVEQEAAEMDLDNDEGTKSR